MWNTLSWCGATTIRSVSMLLANPLIRAEQDTSRVRYLFDRLHDIRSGALLGDYEQAAFDPQASQAMRIGALDAIGSFVRGSSTFLVPGEGVSMNGCRIHFVQAPAERAGGLPSDLRQLTIRTFRRVANDTNASASRRAFATCWQKSMEPPPVVNPTLITLTYVCGHGFDIHNGNPVRLFYKGRLIRSRANRQIECKR